MKQNLSKLFKNLPEIEPSAQLEWNIIKNLRLAQQKKLKNRLYFIQIGFTVSVAALVLAVLELGQTVIKSNFWNFIQLIFSDYKVVVSAWGDYLFSLMETFPTIEISIILIPVCGLLFSFYEYFSTGDRNHYKHI